MVIKINYRIIVLILIVALILAIPNYINYNSLNVATYYANIENGTAIIPIIMYHQIKNSGAGKDVITPHEFESDIEYIAENSYTTITIKDLVEYVSGKGTLPEKPIILSFDDGYLSNYKYAYPLLKKYNMRIVLSLIGKYTDDFTAIHSDNLEYSHVTWDQLKEMVDSGHVEVQNHTYNLHTMGKGRTGCKQKKGESLDDYEQALSKDIGQLQEKLFEVTGEYPIAFTYPYGKYSENTDFVLRKLGFAATLSCDYGVNVITPDTDCLYKLKRIVRPHGKGIARVIKESMKF